jgi:hypothetical protein
VFSQQLRDRVIGIRNFQDHLQPVDELIPKKLREPWLFMNLKES